MPMCKRVKKQILDDHKYGFKAKYAILYRYITKLKQSNLDNVVELVLQKESN